MRAYRDGDLDMITPHEGHKGDTTLKKRAQVAAQMPHTCTVISPQGVPLFVCGGTLLFSRVAEVWAVVDKAVVEYPAYFCRAVKFLLEFYYDLYELQRMQMFVHSEMVWAAKWAGIFGFAYEGMLRNYGEDSKNYYLFSKVRG